MAERKPRTKLRARTERAKPCITGPITLSVSRFADLCGVHHNTVGNWIEEGLPALRSKRETRIDADVAVQWVRARDQADLKRQLEEARKGRDPRQAQAAKTAAEAQLRELDVAERLGQLIPADDVEARWTQILVAVREAVMSVPGVAVQSGLLAPAQEAELEALCRDALIATVERRTGQLEGETDVG